MLIHHFLIPQKFTKFVAGNVLLQKSKYVPLQAKAKNTDKTVRLRENFILISYVT